MAEKFSNKSLTRFSLKVCCLLSFGFLLRKFTVSELTICSFWLCADRLHKVTLNNPNPTLYRTAGAQTKFFNLIVNTKFLCFISPLIQHQRETNFFIILGLNKKVLKYTATFTLLPHLHEKRILCKITSL